jgi:hypothetical protein
MRTALLMAIILGVSSAAHAQDSVLDRRIKADAPGAAVVWLPDSITNGMLAWRISASAGVPLIFEASPLDYRDPAIAAQRFDLLGLSVREALDFLVAQDPRYRWEERDGIVIIRPIGLLADPGDALNQRIAGARGDRVRLDDVLSRVTAAVRRTGVAPVTPAAIDPQEFALDTPGGTVLDLLAAAARAHGGVMWSAAFSIGFKTFAAAGAIVPGDAVR